MNLTSILARRVGNIYYIATIDFLVWSIVFDEAEKVAG